MARWRGEGGLGGLDSVSRGNISHSAHTHTHNTEAHTPPAATSTTPPAHITVSELKPLTADDRPGDTGTWQRRCHRRRRCSEPLHLFGSLQRLIRHPESDADGISEARGVWERFITRGPLGSSQIFKKERKQSSAGVQSHTVTLHFVSSANILTGGCHTHTCRNQHNSLATCQYARCILSTAGGQSVIILQHARTGRVVFSVP